MTTMQETFDALKVRLDAGEKLCIVSFGHDMDSSWYTVNCPDNSQSGSWSSHKNIENLCKRKGWEIIWVGAEMYNPWKKTK